jgi:hypothetical protein
LYAASFAAPLAGLIAAAAAAAVSPAAAAVEAGAAGGGHPRALSVRPLLRRRRRRRLLLLLLGAPDVVATPALPLAASVRALRLLGADLLRPRRALLLRKNGAPRVRLSRRKCARPGCVTVRSQRFEGGPQR